MSARLPKWEPRRDYAAEWKSRKSKGGGGRPLRHAAVYAHAARWGVSLELAARDILVGRAA